MNVLELYDEGACPTFAGVLSLLHLENGGKIFQIGLHRFLPPVPMTRTTVVLLDYWPLVKGFLE